MKPPFARKHWRERLRPAMARLAIAVASASAAVPASAAATDPISEKRLEAFFRPLRGEQMALSPDGHYLAYGENAGGELRIVVLDLEEWTVKTRIVADEDRPILHSKERTPAGLRFLGWASSNRLVFAPQIEMLPQGRVSALIQAVDADGRNPRLLADAKDFQEEIAGIAEPTDGTDPVAPGRMSVHFPVLDVLGFPAGDRSALLVQARGLAGGERRMEVATRLLRIDVQTGKATTLATESPLGKLICDWTGRPRLHRLAEPASGKETYFYRMPGADRWRPLDGAGADWPRFSTAPEMFYRARAIPLQFDADPNVLLYASNVGRDTFELIALNLATQQRTPLIAHPQRDLVNLNGEPSSALVFDEWSKRFVGVRSEAPRSFSIWRDLDLADAQRLLEARFPARTIRLLHWSEDRSRFIVRVSGGSDPGRTFLFRRDRDLLVELMRRAPWLPAGELNPTRTVEFEGPEGAMITGWLTLPRKPRLVPPPLLLWFAGGVPPRAQAEFEPQAQVFADMGFVVCRINNRGVFGSGMRARDALRRAPNETPAQDAIASVEWLARNVPFDRKRVALYGEGLAGYFAIRVTQQHPDSFRCAIAFDPILDFGSWLNPVAVDSGSPAASTLASGGTVQGWIGGGPVTFQQRVDRSYLEGAGATVSQFSLATEQMSRPVFIGARRALTDADASQAAGVARLRGQLRSRGVACATLEFDEDYSLGLPAARARVYRQIDEFINLNLYNYDVKVGPVREVK